MTKQDYINKANLLRNSLVLAKEAGNADSAFQISQELISLMAESIRAKKAGLI